MGEPAMELGEWMQPIRAQHELNLIERVIDVF